MARAAKGTPERELHDFRHWAVAGGAESMAPTNPYELVRLRLKRGAAVVYRKENGRQTWNLLATELRPIWKSGAPFPAEYLATEKVRHKSGRASVDHKTLIARDGLGCFFCFEEKPSEMTIEHLVPRVTGGPDHIANKFRACWPCNNKVGHLSAPEKIRIREVVLLDRAASQPPQAKEELCRA